MNRTTDHSRTKVFFRNVLELNQYNTALVVNRYVVDNMTRIKVITNTSRRLSSPRSPCKEHNTSKTEMDKSWMHSKSSSALSSDW